MPIRSFSARSFVPTVTNVLPNTLRILASVSMAGWVQSSNQRNNVETGCDVDPPLLRVLPPFEVPPVRGVSVMDSSLWSGSVSTNGNPELPHRAIGLVRQADGLQLLKRLRLLLSREPRAELSSGGQARSSGNVSRRRGASLSHVAREAASLTYADVGRARGVLAEGHRLDGRTGDGIDDRVLERLREIDGPCLLPVKPPPPIRFAQNIGEASAR